VETPTEFGAITPFSAISPPAACIHDARRSSSSNNSCGSSSAPTDPTYGYQWAPMIPPEEAFAHADFALMHSAYIMDPIEVQTRARLRAAFPSPPPARVHAQPIAFREHDSDAYRMYKRKEQARVNRIVEEEKKKCENAGTGHS